jgi:hypothetical protein
MENDLLELSRSYPEERRQQEHTFRIVFESGEIKIDAAKVGVVSQVDGEMA